MIEEHERGVGFDIFRGRWGVLAGTWLMALFAAGSQIMPASILPVIMESLTIGPSAAGWLVSATLLAPAILSIPIGLGLDRINNFAVVVLGTGLLLIGNLGAWWTAMAGQYELLVLTRVITGAGIVSIWTSGANIVGGIFRESQAATATGLFTTSAPMGYVLAQFSTPYITAISKWELNFVVFGVASVGAFGLFLVTGRESERTDTVKDSPPPGITDFKRVFTSRGVWIVGCMSFIGYSLHLFFNSWMPSYLSGVFGLTLTKSGLLVALFPAMGVLARATGGVLSDRIFDQRRRPVPLVSFLVTTPLIVIISFTQSPFVLILLLILSGYFIQLGIGLFYAYVRELVSTNVAGSAVAFLSSLSFIGGFTSPLIAGFLIERSSTYFSAFGYALLLAVLGIILAWSAPEP